MALKLGSNDTAILAGSSVVKQMLLGSSPKFAAPVLDHVPGAAAAYSLRRLSNAYTGPVVKVRRSSDSTTADFTAAEVVDGTLTAWVGAGDGFVDTWYDQSGNARHATASGTAQPQIVDSGVLLTEAGRPTLQFDGTEDTFTTSVPLATAITYFLLATPSAGTNDYLLRCLGTGGVPAIITKYDGVSLEFYSADRKTLLQTGESLTIITAIQVDGGRLFGAANGAQAYSATSTSTATDTKTLVSIGSAGAGNGGWAESKISELIIYPSDVSASRELAEGEIAWHYGLQAKLPYNHAYAPQALGGASQTVPTDSDVLAFAAASGAKSIPDLNKIEDLVTYLKAQGLWNYARFYPMKSSQNAGTGSTVYGLGGLTTNNMTLVNSPTWGSDGVTFDAASSQHGRISDFSGGGTVSYWWRGAAVTSGIGVLLSQWNGGAAQRSVQFFDDNGTLRMSRSSDGAASGNYTDGAMPLTDTCLSAEWVDAGGETFWKNKQQQSLVFSGGTAVTERHDSTANIVLMGQDVTGVYESGTVVLAGFIETALTTTQRETITDLINAL